MRELDINDFVDMEIEEIEKSVLDEDILLKADDNSIGALLSPSRYEYLQGCKDAIEGKKIFNVKVRGEGENLFLPIPFAIMIREGWQVGDRLVFEKNENGGYSLRKFDHNMDTEKDLITTIIEDE